jgi:hypothetical protein
MNTFPFTATEWQGVEEASHRVLNATLSDDSILRASAFEGLLAVLDGLRSRYGDHPILLETEADFLEDPLQRVLVYRSALERATSAALPTLSIRLSLACVLLESFHDTEQAARELMACKSEVEDADEHDRNAWMELVRECRRQ